MKKKIDAIAQKSTVMIIPNQLQLTGYPDGNGNTIFAMFSAQPQWVSFGIGATMKNADVYVGWPNSTGGVTVSSRKSVALAMPAVATDPNVIGTQIAVPGTIPPWCQMAFAISRPTNGGNSVANAQSYIWAVGPTPANVDSNVSAFNIHANYGVVTNMFTTPIAGGAGGAANGAGKAANGTAAANGANAPAAGAATPAGNNGVKANAANGTTGGTAAIPTTPAAKTGAAAAASNTTVGANGNSFCVPNTFCVYGKPDGNGSTIFTVHSAAAGWASVGVGSSMTGSIMYVGWLNSTQGVTFSCRDGTGLNVPQISTRAAVSAKMVSLSVPAPAWAKISFSFSRPSMSAANAVSVGSNYIYATAAAAPSMRDDRTSSFPIHDSRGYFMADFTQANSNSSVIGAPSTQPIMKLPASWTYDMVIAYHGYIMLVAWGLMPWIGVFIARFLNDALGVWWYRLHVFVMLVPVTLLGFAGIFMITLFKNGPHFTKSIHEILGLTVGISSVLQVALGFFCDYMWSPDRESIPWWDKLHWMAGRVITLSAFLNIAVGLYQMVAQGYVLPTALPVIFALFTVSGIALHVYGQQKFGQVHHVKPAPIDQYKVNYMESYKF